MCCECCSNLYYWCVDISTTVSNVVKIMLQIIIMFCVLILIIILLSLFLGLIGDGIQYTYICHGDAINFGQCVKNGVMGLVYIMISIASFILPIELLGIISKNKNVTTANLLQPPIHWYKIIIFSVLIIIWIFAAPLIGIVWSIVGKGICIEYNATFIWCGIIGDITLFIIALILAMFGGIRYLFDILINYLLENSQIKNNEIKNNENKNDENKNNEIKYSEIKNLNGKNLDNIQIL